MSYLIDLKTFTDKRGNLTVLEKTIPFEIKRIFYIYGVDGSDRGGHRHHSTVQAAICLKGSCMIYATNGNHEHHYKLESPSQCLILNPEDWHMMYQFSQDSILMILASEYFNPDDYIYEKYSNTSL